MKCKTCGFAASDPSVTDCPFCAAQGAGNVWPPAPAVAPAYLMPGDTDLAVIQKQRQAGILLAVIPLVIVQAAASYRNLLPAPYGLAVWGVICLACIYPHFRGCAHWAESKGYPRYEGRLLAIIGWLGVLFLAIRRDKTRIPA